MRAEVVLPPVPSSVTRARGWVTETLDGLDGDGRDGLVESVRLVVSELVGNTVRHAGTPLVVAIRVEPDVVRVGVADSGPGRVRALDRSPLATDGRGLALVASVSDRWGVRVTASGKEVWSEWVRAPA